MKPDIKNDFEIVPLLEKRWSPRAFDAKPVEQDKLNRLFEALRWAPSCYNDQPWNLLVGVKGTDMFDKLLSCLVEQNQVWAKEAPVLIITVARTTFAHNDKPNKHAWHDIGLGIAQLTVQATHEGLYVHQMAGIDASKVKETFDIPKNYEAVTAVAVGYPGDASGLPDKLAESELEEQTRKPQSEFVFTTEWPK